MGEIGDSITPGIGQKPCTKNRVLQSGDDCKGPGEFQNQYNSGITRVLQLQPVLSRNWKSVGHSKNDYSGVCPKSVCVIRT